MFCAMVYPIGVKSQNVKVYAITYQVFFLETKVTPLITTNIPKTCKVEIRSSKKKKAKIMVDIGPKLPKIAKVEAPSRLIAAETKNDGIKVERMAIAPPSA